MRKGFTLLELLVVIAIIGVLSSLFVSNYMEIRKKSRDAKRMADLREIQKALELYRQDQDPSSYPDVLPNPCSAWEPYINSMPGDPLGNCENPISYSYLLQDTGDYILVACLESITNGENVVSCADVGIDCAAIIGNNSNGKCYVLKP